MSFFFNFVHVHTLYMYTECNANKASIKYFTLDSIIMEIIGKDAFFSNLSGAKGKYIK